MKIPITKPLFDNKELKAVTEPLKSGWVVQGPCVKKFEELFSNFTKKGIAIASSSCTTALHMLLIAADIKKGDHVIVPSFTFIATANSVEYMGARPIFCDIDLKTFNIDTNHLEKILKKNKKIKAIVPVHLFGLCSDINRIIKLSKKYKVTVIEDSACALGAYYNNRHAGTFGFGGAFSFHPRKAITTGEGGMILTLNKNVEKKCRSLRDHGASKTDLQRHTEKGGSLLPDYHILGYNYRMTDIQGSLGIIQMKKAQTIINGRKKCAKRYDKLLKDIQWIQTPFVPKGYIHAYQSYVCLIKKEYFNNDIKKANIFRNNLMMKLEKKGISTRQGTHAFHTLHYYKIKYKLKDNSFPKAYESDRLSITLPLYPQMSLKKQEYVVNNIKKLGI